MEQKWLYAKGPPQLLQKQKPFLWSTLRLASPLPSSSMNKNEIVMEERGGERPPS